MYLLSDRAKPNSNNNVYGQENIVGADSSDDVGWVDSEPFIGNHEDEDKYRLIRLVNDSIPLIVCFKKYNIKFETKGSSAGWTHICSCPFKDHRDSSPSFGYNPKLDRFNCFGCGRNGRSVQFIAFMENKQPEEVARILSNEIPYIKDSDKVDNSTYIDYKRLEKTLFDYANYVREFKESHNNSDMASKYAEDVTWNLDVYLRKTAMSEKIVLDDLEHRILKLKQQLDRFGIE